MNAKKRLEISDLVQQLKQLVCNIPDNVEAPSSLSDKNRKSLKQELISIVAVLESFVDDLDPIKLPNTVFDPSDPVMVGQLIARTLVSQPKVPLGKIERFYGSGVYAIYYNGSFEAYKDIVNSEIPIYVGKVNPASSSAITPEEQGDKLWHRLTKDHSKNVGLAINLDVSDFQCKYLVVKSAWQNTAEDYLISWFQPAWNNETKICYGFGKHGDDAAKRGHPKSLWDELHPGRPWADRSKKNPKSPDDIIADIKRHYSDNLPSIIAASKNL